MRLKSQHVSVRTVALAGFPGVRSCLSFQPCRGLVPVAYWGVAYSLCQLRHSSLAWLPSRVCDLCSWLHSLSGVIRSLLCNPRAFSPAIIIKWVELARNRNKWLGANTTSVYPCRSCEIPRAHVRANTEKMRDCHLVARTCDNEVGRGN